MNNDKFKNKYRIPSIRLANWDYGSNGLYYITICTKNRKPYFGDIVCDCPDVETQNFASLPQTQNFTSLPPAENTTSAFLHPTEIGKIANENWEKIPEHFPFIELDEFVIMPDHMHGILSINKPDKNDWHPNQFGVQSQNLGSVLRGYKASVKTYATKHSITFAWHERYHDRIIRNERELQNIRRYINQNPLKWWQAKNNVKKKYIEQHIP